MKLKTIMIAALAASMPLASIAGMVQPRKVVVDLVALTADGDMLTSRTDGTKNTFIGCGLRKIEDGAGGILNFGFCQAEDAEEEKIICFTQNPDLLDAIDAISDSSYVTFSWELDEEKNANCTRIGVSTQSFYLGKHVEGNI